MANRRPGTFLALVVAALAAGACDAANAGYDPLCQDGSRPLPETGLCEEAGDPGDPCAGDWDCAPGSICHDSSYCVGSGALRVTLAFRVDSDFDLHVITPTGSEIYYANVAADGGLLDVDQCVTTCGETGHVENVVFAESALPGTYEIFAVNYDGRASGRFVIEVAKASGYLSFGGHLAAVRGQVGESFTFVL